MRTDTRNNFVKRMSQISQSLLKVLRGETGWGQKTLSWNQSQQTFSVKDSVVNVLGSVGHLVSVANI